MYLYIPAGAIYHLVNCRLVRVYLTLTLHTFVSNNPFIRAFFHAANIGLVQYTGSKDPFMVTVILSCVQLISIVEHAWKI